MTTPIITLTTDFGTASPYVAVMKGVILSLAPEVRIVDLTHQIRPQDLDHANYFLATAIPYFPTGTIHVCVVDPGVGSERTAVAVEAGEQILVGPNNGIFTEVLKRLGGAERIINLTERRFWRENISHTFHGRDIFSPVAAYLAGGLALDQLGPELQELVELQSHSAVVFDQQISGQIQFIDDFGNVITNVPNRLIEGLPFQLSLNGEAKHAVRWVQTYADAASGEVVCLFSSDGFLELAMVNGNAAARLNAKIGGEIMVDFQ